MRYTTLIDISEFPEVYKNHNARLLYLHMALKAGYRDDDRDMLPLSIRNLSAQAGVTLSACRNALKVLQRARLITRQGDTWIVRKWCEQQPITTRRKTKAEEQRINQAAERKRLEAERERAQAIEELQREQWKSEGKTSWMIYYESRKALADAGSQEDAAWCARNLGTYERQAAKMEAEKNGYK